MATFCGLGFGTNMALRRSACGAGKVFDERLGFHHMPKSEVVEFHEGVEHSKSPLL